MSDRWSQRLVLILAGLSLAFAGPLARSGTPPASTAPAATPVVFAAAGDFSSSPEAAGVLHNIGTGNTDLTLALGDLSYGTTGQEQAWCDFVTTRVGEGYPFELISGNHEERGVNGNINDFSACLPNQLPGLVGTYGRQYYVDVPAGEPRVRFVMLSPSLAFPGETYSYDQGTPRYRWAARAIDGARAADIPWVVVGLHKPCLTTGEYGCGMGRDLQDLLVAKRVDLVLSGHEHLYQRTKQLQMSTACPTLDPTAFDDDCIADSDSTMVAGEGTVQATVGTGGIPARSVNQANPAASYFAALSGANLNEAYGWLRVSADDVSMSADFVPTVGTFTDSFTLTRPATTGNRPPLAGFGSSCSADRCDFDASLSTDLDGSLTSYTWDFGDGTTGTGPTPSHAYSGSGSYAVQLTVTDDDGGTASTTRQVTITTGSQVIDHFERTVASGLGTADVGGSWTAPASTSVGSGHATLPLSAGRSGLVALDQATLAGVDLRAVTWLDGAPNGSGGQVTLIGRRVAGVGDYRFRVQVDGAGRLTGALLRAPAGAAPVRLAAGNLPGVTYAANLKLNLRLSVSGTSPTTLRAKVWPATGTEPASWTMVATDATAGLQTSGSTGFQAGLTSTVTNGPIRAHLDDFVGGAP